ncbi:MAG TPA: hypothetical protein VK508_03670 [Cyclobacteriaceae bacterium]|nr:hypothetical protein [Cyclobacteriaceae bacterium]
MISPRPRLLYISSILPDTSCGAHIAIYRHFVVKNDFEVAVAGYVSGNAMVENKFTIQRSRFFERLTRTRFSRIAYNIEYLLNWYVVPSDLLSYARNFKPDAIFTVPDNMHSGLAKGLSKRLGVPLITDFQDLFPISTFIPFFMEPFSWMRQFLLKKFHFLHDHSDLVFYTSEGMQKFFGKHKNGHILYPIGDFELLSERHQVPQRKPPLVIVYAGNCYGAYGRMLLAFARMVKGSPDIRLKIFPVGRGWTDEEVSEMRTAGIYQNFLPFAELRKELEAADAFLTVMSFEAAEVPFVKTSFTTKWLDYAPYGKPIFVWGPEYCSAVVFARKYACGIVVSEENAASLRGSIIQLDGDQEAWDRYGNRAKAVSVDVLNPNSIHEILVSGVRDLSNS